MIDDIKIMGYLFMALVLLYAFGYIFVWIRKTQIEKKTEIYQKLLRHAMATRKKYISTLSILDNSKLKMDTQLGELRSEKARLQSVRASLREIAAEIRKRQAVEKIDNITAKIISQKKILFGEHWKVLNNFRCRYNIYLQTYHIVEKEYEKHYSLAAAASLEWEKERDCLMSLYNELRDVTNLPDPRMSFSMSK